MERYDILEPGAERYQQTGGNLFGEDKAVFYEYRHINGSRFSVIGETLTECRKQRDRWLKSFSVAFTGHRTKRILSVGTQTQERLKELVYTHLRTLCADGYHTFLCGMAEGFDLMTAEQVLFLKQEFTGIRLIAVIPFRGQEREFTLNNRRIYSYVCRQADEVVILSDTYFKGCFSKRNDYLLCHAGRLVAYFDGLLYGGTAYTVRKAEHKGIRIDNLFEP